MKHSLVIFLFFLCFFLIVSCDRAMFDAGPPDSKKIDLQEGFSRIMINKTFDVTLVPDSVNKVIFKAGKNLLPEVDATIKDNVLWLDYDIHYNWSRKYEKIKAELHLKEIPVIQVMEPSRITTTDTFRTDHFSLEDWGKFAEVNVIISVNSCSIGMSIDNFGSYKIRGVAANSYFSANGSASINASELVCQNSTVESSTIADILVHATKTLNVRLASSGKVYYWGNPQISLVKTGEGVLIKK